VNVIAQWEVEGTGKRSIRDSAEVWQISNRKQFDTKFFASVYLQIYLYLSSSSRGFENVQETDNHGHEFIPFLITFKRLSKIFGIVYPLHFSKTPHI
jgi:hypothetical protein